MVGGRVPSRLFGDATLAREEEGLPGGRAPGSPADVMADLPRMCRFGSLGLLLIGQHLVRIQRDVEAESHIFYRLLPVLGFFPRGDQAKRVCFGLAEFDARSFVEGFVVSFPQSGALDVVGEAVDFS